MSNTVTPVATYYHSEGKIVLIPMRPSRVSVGIVLDEKPDEAKFPWDFDERFIAEAQQISNDICRGHYGMLEELLARKDFYTMPYPIQRQ